MGSGSRDAGSVAPGQRVGRNWLIDDSSTEFAAWLAARSQQSRVKGGDKMKEQVT
jgi:hypothetical protein